MRPYPARFMPGVTAWLIQKTARRLTSRTLSQSFPSISSRGRPTCPNTPPALLTSTCTGFPSLLTSLTKSCTSARFLTLTVRASQRPPAPFTNEQVSLTSSFRISQAQTAAPRPANAWAMALPKPCTAPVTITLCPEKSYCMVRIAFRPVHRRLSAPANAGHSQFRGSSPSCDVSGAWHGPGQLRRPGPAHT